MFLCEGVEPHRFFFETRLRGTRPDSVSPWGLLPSLLFLPMYPASRCAQARPRSSGRSVSERNIGIWFPRSQYRNMRLAVGVRSADPMFVTVVVHFQVVGHLLTAHAVT